jgi:signal transduction histidine kinase
MDDVTERPKRIVIHTQQIESTMALVEIEDSGIGLVDIEKIFEPFFTTKEHGMGIGLAICRSIAEEHKGKLWATPNTRFGTTFRFTLPLQANESARPEQS